MTVGQLEGLISPATPVAALLILGVLVLGYFVTRRLVRAIGKVSSSTSDADQQLRESIGRIGARVGQLERGRALDGVRRYQLEACLRGRGIALPPWPDDEDLDVVDGQDDVDQPNTAHLETQYFIPPRPAPRRTP